MEFTADEIDKALAGEGSETAQVPVRDISGMVRQWQVLLQAGREWRLRAGW